MVNILSRHYIVHVYLLACFGDEHWLEPHYTVMLSSINSPITITHHPSPLLSSVPTTTISSRQNKLHTQSNANTRRLKASFSTKTKTIFLTFSMNLPYKGLSDIATLIRFYSLHDLIIMIYEFLNCFSFPKITL